MDFRDEVLDQLDFYWEQWRPRLDGLTDAEYFWEPVAGCWTVRRTERGWGWDFSFPPPDPPPFTTIAWRLSHLAEHVFAMRFANHFGDGSYRMDHHDYPGGAAAALDRLDDRHRRWRDAIGSMPAERWSRPVGPAEGPHAKRSYLTLVLHLNRELFHHGGEVALLRDLHRSTGTAG
ncbi:DinB family protein [Saccharopolyspora sp. MS10]|uniref:DinB family protein n=1 Tax=Saccharopolyspora sp. MS10 TaxID=3385973 RepID=UPI0039A157DE